MSDVPSRSRMDRVKDLWWLFGAVTFVLGGAAGGFVKYTSWYILEQNRATTLEALNQSTGQMAIHLREIDAKLLEQKYTNITATDARVQTGDHLHALDGRADASDNRINAMDKLTDKHDQSILFILGLLKVPGAPPIGRR